jgi:hypothetical protein
MLEAGAEVARVELKEDVDIEHYASVPAIGSERLEIAFIEVATSEYESRGWPAGGSGAGAAASRASRRWGAGSARPCPRAQRYGGVSEPVEQPWLRK